MPQRVADQGHAAAGQAGGQHHGGRERGCGLVHHHVVVVAPAHGLLGGEAVDGGGDHGGRGHRGGRQGGRRRGQALALGRQAGQLLAAGAGVGAQLVDAAGQLGQALLLDREHQAPVGLAGPLGLARQLEVGAGGAERPLLLALRILGGLQPLAGGDGRPVTASDLLAAERPGPAALPLDLLAQLGGGALAVDHRLPCRQQGRLGLAPGGPDAAAGAQPGGPAHRGEAAEVRHRAAGRLQPLQQLADALLGLGQLLLQRAQLALHAVDLLVGVVRLACLGDRGVGPLAGGTGLLTLGAGGLCGQLLLLGAALQLGEGVGVVDQGTGALVGLPVEAREQALRPFQEQLVRLGAQGGDAPLDLLDVLTVHRAAQLACAGQGQERMVGDLRKARRADADDLAGDRVRQPPEGLDGGAVHRGGDPRHQQHAAPFPGEAGHHLGDHRGRVRPHRRPDHVEAGRAARRPGGGLLGAQPGPWRRRGPGRRVEDSGLEALGKARLAQRLQRADQGAQGARRVRGGDQPQPAPLCRTQHDQAVAPLGDHLGDRQRRARVADRHQPEVAQGADVDPGAAQVDPVAGGARRGLPGRLGPGGTEVDLGHGRGGRLQLLGGGGDHLAQPRRRLRRGVGRPPHLRPGNGSTRRRGTSAGMIARFAAVRQSY